MSLQRLWKYVWRTVVVLVFGFLFVRANVIRWSDPSLTDTEIFIEIFRWKRQHEDQDN